MVRIEEMRLGRIVKFRGLSEREGDINSGRITGTCYEIEHGFFYVPVHVKKFADGSEDARMVICSENIVGVRDE